MCMIGSCKKEKIVAHCESVYVGTLGLKDIKREKLPTIKKKKKNICIYIYIYLLRTCMQLRLGLTLHP